MTRPSACPLAHSPPEWNPECSWRFPSSIFLADPENDSRAFVGIPVTPAELLPVLTTLGGPAANCDCVHWTETRLPFSLPGRGDLWSRDVDWVDSAAISALHQGGMARIDKSGVTALPGCPLPYSAILRIDDTHAYAARTGAVDLVEIQGAQCTIRDTLPYASTYDRPIHWMTLESGSSSRFFTMTSTGTLAYHDGTQFQILATLPLSPADLAWPEPVDRYARSGGLTSVESEKVFAVLNSERVFEVSLSGHVETLAPSLEYAADHRITAIAATTMGVLVGDGSSMLHRLEERTFLPVPDTGRSSITVTGEILRFREGAVATSNPGQIKQVRPYGSSCASQEVVHQGHPNEAREGASNGIDTLVVTDFFDVSPAEILWLEVE